MRKFVAEEQFENVKEEGFEHYLVSSYGRIINDRTQRELRGSISLEGARVVLLTRPDGSTKRFTVHRLVAQAFLGDYDPLKEVLHRNYIKDDNSVYNLKMGWKSRGGQR